MFVAKRKIPMEATFWRQKRKRPRFPLHHGKGLGSALMQHAIIMCDQDNKIAYLESSNPKNISFYERYGFELLGTIQVNTSPSIFLMLRNPSRL
jgi:predicted N-acetyltransferase YhbS